MAWKCKDKEQVKACGLIFETRQVLIYPMARRKIELLLKANPKCEWMSFMVGYQDKVQNFYITDLIIPRHKVVGGGMAEVFDNQQPPMCLGVLHSHHDMGAFHSGTDFDYVDKNYPLSVTVSTMSALPEGMSFDAVSYTITECGRELKAEHLVCFTKPEPLFSEDAFINDSMKLIHGKKAQAVKSNKTSCLIIKKSA